MITDDVMTHEEIKEERLLIFARKLISRPQHWTKGSYARDEKGISLPRECRQFAYCYCAVGATMKAADSLNLSSAAQSARIRLAQVINNSTDSLNTSIIDYNDDVERTHAEILELFDNAIASIRLAHHG